MQEHDTATMDADARLDWCWDWAAWLVDGDTITDAQLIPTGVIVDDQTRTDTTVTAWLTAGDNPARSAEVTCRITTAQGRRDDRTLRIHITDR